MSCAIARGLVRQRFRRFDDLEMIPRSTTAAPDHPEGGFGAVVDARCASSMEFVPDRIYYGRSLIPKASAGSTSSARFRPWSRPAVVIFHDTAPHSSMGHPGIVTLAAGRRCTVSNLSRHRGVLLSPRHLCDGVLIAHRSPRS